YKSCDAMPYTVAVVRLARLATQRRLLVQHHEPVRHQEKSRRVGPFPARHVSLRDVSSVSRIMIFCQILRDSPVVSVSTSFTASSSTGSWECCTYSTATLLVSDSSSEQ